MHDTPTEILKKYWGFEQFRSPQEEIIKNILAKNDTMALLPTGGGKSLCYQVPALLLEGKTIVITPLIALMEDQVQALKKKNIAADCIHSQLKFRDMDRILDNFVHGDTQILYISPERIQTDVFSERYKKAKVELIAIDEAHCISQWGYDFRPSYFNILLLKDWKPKVTFLALTATATADVIKDMEEKLQLKNYAFFRKSFLRENISFFSVETSDKLGELFNIISKINACSIIYVRNRGETVDFSNWLNKKGITSLPYHGGMSKEQRDANQRAWMTNKVRNMVSTNAFGMGIDKPDVRLVVHVDIPSSLEEYYQEAGRAGRDGNESWAVLLYDVRDITNAQSKINEQYPEIQTIAKIYDLLCRYFKIAYGSGFDESYEFDLGDFSKSIEVPVKQVFPVLQILEREGWITLSEGLSEPTRFQIACSHYELFEPGFLHPEWEKIIVYLLRKYEGVFSQMVKIDENILARDLNMSLESVQEKLSSMQKEGIINVVFRKSVPSIHFNRERPELQHFFIDKKRYDEQKSRALVRLDSMVTYVSSEEKCRQSMILAYFDETYEACGKCDFCRMKKLDVSFEKIKSDVLAKIERASQTYSLVSVKSVLMYYPYLYRSKVKSALQFLENERIIKIEDNGNVIKL